MQDAGLDGPSLCGPPMDVPAHTEKKDPPETRDTGLSSEGQRHPAEGKTEVDLLLQLLEKCGSVPFRGGCSPLPKKEDPEVTGGRGGALPRDYIKRPPIPPWAGAEGLT